MYGLYRPFNSSRIPVVPASNIFLACHQTFYTPLHPLKDKPHCWIAYTGYRHCASRSKLRSLRLHGPIDSQHLHELGDRGMTLKSCLNGTGCWPSHAPNKAHLQHSKQACQHQRSTLPLSKSRWRNCLSGNSISGCPYIVRATPLPAPHIHVSSDFPLGNPAKSGAQRHHKSSFHALSPLDHAQIQVSLLTTWSSRTQADLLARTAAAISSFLDCIGSKTYLMRD